MALQVQYVTVGLQSPVSWPCTYSTLLLVCEAPSRGPVHTVRYCWFAKPRLVALESTCRRRLSLHPINRHDEWPAGGGGGLTRRTDGMASLVLRTHARPVCLPGMYYVRLTKRSWSVRCRSNIIIFVFRELVTREFGMTHGNVLLAEVRAILLKSQTC